MSAPMDDFRVQLMRNKVVPGKDVFEAAEGMVEQVHHAAAAEGAEQPYAYAEWLKVAAMCYMRAVYLAHQAKPSEAEEA